MHIIEKINKIHFIGVGGISMSALAKLMFTLKKKVTGSDSSYSRAIIEMSEKGLDVYIGSDISKVRNAELVVYSSAISENDPELKEARACNLPTIERFTFLGEVAKYYEKCIAIGGTHGKTTSTAMLTHLFKEAKMNFTSHIGGYADDDIGNLYVSGREYFITEACEYKKSLLSLSPYITVVLNADHDHPDTYKGLSEIYDVFDEFLSKTIDGGYKFVCYDTDYYKKRQKCNSDVITYGFEEGSIFRAVAIEEYKKGYYKFNVMYNDLIILDLTLNVVGIFNIYNALVSASIGYLMGIDASIIERACQSFKGVKRRFEYMGEVNGAKIFLDYAHHPKEIKAVINSALRINEGRLLIAFQPHTFTRTLSLMSEFVECFEGYDELMIVKSYSAREIPEQGMTAFELYRIIEHKGGVSYYDSILPLAKYFCSKAQKNDTILILGAGDIDSIIDLIID